MNRSLYYAEIKWKACRDGKIKRIRNNIIMLLWGLLLLFSIGVLMDFNAIFFYFFLIPALPFFYLLLTSLLISDTVSITQKGLRIPANPDNILYRGPSRFVPFVNLAKIRINKFNWIILITKNGERIIINKGNTIPIDSFIKAIKERTDNIVIERDSL